MRCALRQAKKRTYRTSRRLSTGSRLWRGRTSLTAKGCGLTWLEVAQLCSLPTARGITTWSNRSISRCSRPEGSNQTSSHCHSSSGKDSFLQDTRPCQHRVSTRERPDKLHRQRLLFDLAGSSATLLLPHSSWHCRPSKHSNRRCNRPRRQMKSAVS